MPPNLDVPTANRCAFCDYLAGARPFTILTRSQMTATLVTREQRGRSHLLVIPLMHRETVLDLSPDEATSLMASLIEAAKIIDLAEQRPGIAIWQNNGQAADQTIPHVHFHVAGTVPGGATERGDVRELSLNETDQIAARLRPYLAG